jgi:type I restriction enzyme S subunit
MTGAGGLKRVPDEFTRDFHTLWPEPNEQERIATFLDDKTARIDALIAEKERLIVLLTEQRLSVSERVIVCAPGDVKAKLGFHVDLLPGYAFPSDEFNRDPDNIPLLRGINVAPAGIRWDEVVYWPREYDTSLERFRLKAGDVVLGMDRPWVSSGARVAMIDGASEGSFLLQRVCRLRGGSKWNQRFLFYALSSDEFRQSVEVDLTGVSVPHISPEQILGFKVPVLTPEEQIERCEAADRELLRIDQLQSHTILMLSRLREYRSSLISAAVTGQLDVASTKKVA